MAKKSRNFKKVLDRRRWDLHRFGLTPTKCQARLFNRHEPRVVVISVPKAGTHLIERALCLHPKLYRPLLPTLHPNNIAKFGGLDRILQNLKSGEVLITHLHYSKQNADLLKSSGVKVIVMIRDPRDIVVSRAHYVVSNKKHPYHAYMQGLSLEDRLHRSIVGDSERGYLSIAQTLEWFAGWLDTEYLVIRFEDMISAKKRYASIKHLFSYLGMHVPEELTAWIARNVISEASPTFRRGTSGGWQEYLKGGLYALFFRNSWCLDGKVWI